MLFLLYKRRPVAARISSVCKCIRKRRERSVKSVERIDVERKRFSLMEDKYALLLSYTLSY